MCELDTLICHVTVVTMDPRMEVLFGGYVGVTAGKISYIGKKAPEEKPATLIDGTGMVLLPGLVNCHTHLGTSLLRYACDDMTRGDALRFRLAREEKMDHRCVKAAALLSIAECLRFGVTSVSDLYGDPNAVAEAAAEAGINANVAMSACRYEDEAEDFDFETDIQCAELRRVKEKWHGYDDGRIRVDVGIHAPYTSNYKLWEALSGYAVQESLGFQLHLSQSPEEVDDCLNRTGLTPAELLNCHGVFGVPVTAAGCACLTDGERKLLGKRNLTAVACPKAAARLGYPALPIQETVSAGINVALGTGGVPESDSLDLFSVMGWLGLSARAAGGELPASALLMMATVCGAKAQGRGTRTGMIQEGFDADLILVDFTAPHLMPCHNVLSALVYGVRGGDVAMTMVRGKILYQNGKFPTIDLNAVLEDLTGYAIPRAFAQSEQNS